MQVTATALQGIDQAQGRFEQAAGQIASIGASDNGFPVDTVDLSQSAVSLLSAKNDFAASLKLLEVANRMQGQAINLLA